MEDAETRLRRLADKHGFTVRVLPAIPLEAGWIELRRDRVTLRAAIPRYEELGYDPWDTLAQALYALVEG